MNIETKSYIRRLTSTAAAIADLQYVPCIDSTPAGWWLNRINVPAPHRGKGVGSSLLDEVIADCRLHGHLPILLTINATDARMTRTRLVRWYKRRGFEPLPGTSGKVYCLEK